MSRLSKYWNYCYIAIIVIIFCLFLLQMFQLHQGLATLNASILLLIFYGFYHLIIGLIWDRGFGSDRFLRGLTNLFLAFLSCLVFCLEATLYNLLPDVFNAADKEGLKLAFFNSANSISIFLLLYTFLAFFQLSLKFTDLISVICLQYLDIVSRFLFHLIEG